MGDRIHRWLAVLAVAIAIVAFAGWRSLHGASATGRARGAPPTVPSPQLAQLIPYSTPIADTLTIAPPPRDSITISRDPFANGQLPRVVASSVDTTQRVIPVAPAEQWHVTTTLMAGTRRAALINDELIYVGDPLPGGGILTSVERDHVVVKDNKGATHTVAVKEGNG